MIADRAHRQPQAAVPKFEKQLWDSLGHGAKLAGRVTCAAEPRPLTTATGTWRTVPAAPLRGNPALRRSASPTKLGNLALTRQRLEPRRPSSVAQARDELRCCAFEPAQGTSR
jgi:hypothetical protein